MANKNKLFHVGNHFDRLTLVASLPPRRLGQQARMWAFCSCGGERIVTYESWREGINMHCGCGAPKDARSHGTTHGFSKTKEYAIFRAMWQRCTNPRNKAYNDYGGRGIKVDERWQKFERFIADVGMRPGPLWSLDRIDCNGDYSPENVRWAIKSDQANNRRNTRYVTAFGKTQPLSHWAAELGISYSCLEGRLKNSPPESACVSGKYQANPTRTSRRKLITHQGLTLSHKEWGHKLGISPLLISKRIRKGYSVEEAFYKGAYPNYWRKNGIGSFARLKMPKK